MQIIITVTATGKMVTCEVEGHMSVEDVKALILKQEGIEVSRLVTPRTIESKVDMLDDRTLESYHIKKEAQLQLVTGTRRRPTGTMRTPPQRGARRRPSEKSASSAAVSPSAERSSRTSASISPPAKRRSRSGTAAPGRRRS